MKSLSKGVIGLDFCYECLNKLRYIYFVEYYVVVKKDEVVLYMLTIVFLNKI